jgi:hypothetical protein
VTRRLALLPFALIAIVSLAAGACTPPPPPAPALTDPKDIVAKGVTSLADIRTFEFTGTFSGTVNASQLGSFDLTTAQMKGSVDLANQAVKFSLDAPTVVGTKIDAIVVGGTLYYRIAGLLAPFVGGNADQYTKVAVPTASLDPAVAALNMPTLVASLQEWLGRLPTPLTRAADDTCGGADCYHVTTTLSGAQLQTLDARAALDGAVTVDLWTRKSDYRPGKLTISVASPSLGTFGATVEINYDVAVSVSAPGVDQIAP